MRRIQYTFLQQKYLYIVFVLRRETKQEVKRMHQELIRYCHIIILYMDCHELYPCVTIVANVYRCIVNTCLN